MNVLLKVAIPIVLLGTYYAVFLRPDIDDPFARPFCDANGFCHERPDKPSPRTAYSAWNKEQYNLWLNYCEELKEKVTKYKKRRQTLFVKEQLGQLTGRPRPLILLGDSITESWDGTGLGVPKVRAQGVPEVLEEMLKTTEQHLDPIVLGVSGDQTQHLLYRLEHDHMRAAQLTSESTNGGETVGYDPSAIFVVMIGTNNLGSGELPGPTATGILAVVDYLLEETKEAGCHVMLFEVLPRGDGHKVLPKLCPPRCSDDEKLIPFSSFMPAVDKANEAVTKGVEDLSKTYPGRIKLVDCGTEFLNPGYSKKDGSNTYEVKQEIMPDLLHPNADGHVKMAKCIQNYIHGIDAEK